MKKNISLKKYIIAIIICIFSILFVFYIFSWINLFKDKKYSKSYLVSSKTVSLEVNDIAEIENTFSEAPSEYFIFIGFHNDEEIYNLEKSLKKIIDKYKLNDIFYYIDITDLKNEDGYIDKINNVFNLDHKIQSVPTILYFKNRKLVSDGIVTRFDDNMINVGDFEHLLDMYEFKVNK